nr:13658_t:CDS:2 [Entrophospora candida]
MKNVDEQKQLTKVLLAGFLAYVYKASEFTVVSFQNKLIEGSKVSNDDHVPCLSEQNVITTWQLPSFTFNNVHQQLISRTAGS